MNENREGENSGHQLMMFRLMRKRRYDNTLPAILSETFPDTNALHYILQHSRNDLNIPDRHGYLPIHMAILNGNLRFVLMAHGVTADVLNKHTIDGKHTCLSLAVKSGRTEIARYILMNNPELADIETDPSKGRPIHMAVLDKRNDIIKDILRYAPDTINSQKADGRYAIHLAATRTPTQVKILLDHDRTQLNKDDSDGNFPQHFAAICGAVESLKEIFKYLQDEDAIRRCLLAINHTRCTPLYMASSSGHVEMVRFLLDTCPESALVSAAKDTYPVHIACQQRHYQVVKLLLERAPESARFYRSDHLLPLNMAVRDVSAPPPLDLLKLLILAFPDAVHNQNIEGLTILQVLRRTKYTSQNPSRVSGNLSNGHNPLIKGTDAKASRILPTVQIRYIVNSFPQLDEKLYRELNWYLRKLPALLSYPELPSQSRHDRGEVNIFAKIKMANSDVWRHIIMFL